MDRPDDGHLHSTSHMLTTRINTLANSKPKLHSTTMVIKAESDIMEFYTRDVS
jgi:hypothetical protein